MKKVLVIVVVLTLGFTLFAQTLDDYLSQSSSQKVITSTSVAQGLLEGTIVQTPQLKAISAYEPSFSIIEKADFENEPLWPVFKDWLLRLFFVVTAFFADNWYYAIAYTFAFACYLVLFFTLLNSGVPKKERLPRLSARIDEEDKEDLELSQAVVNDFSRDKVYE